MKITQLGEMTIEFNSTFLSSSRRLTEQGQNLMFLNDSVLDIYVIPSPEAKRSEFFNGSHQNLTW